jgi:hypothetical protein
VRASLTTGKIVRHLVGLQQRGYSFLGETLSLIGVILLILSAAVLKSNGFAALGISAILIGITAMSLPKKIEASGSMKIMVEDAAISTDRILESNSAILAPPSEDGGSLLERTVFLPPIGGVVQAFVPSSSIKTTGVDLDLIRSAPFGGAFSSLSKEKLPPGVLVYPVGATIPSLPELKVNEDDVDVIPPIQNALPFVLVEVAELCTAVNSSEIGENIIVELEGVKKIPLGKAYETYLGSVPASLVATTIATVRGKAVSIVEETDTPTRKVLSIKVWG